MKQIATTLSEKGSPIPSSRKKSLSFSGWLPGILLMLASFVSYHVKAVVVTIGSPLGSTYDMDYSTSTYSGLRANVQYTTGVAIYGAEEIGTAGKITSYAVNKTSGAATVVLDSVYIFMKEVSTGTKMPSSPVSLDGYTLVFEGNFPNGAKTGWMTATLTTPFVYSGAGNLSVLIVKRSSTTSTAQNYYNSYVSGTGYGCGYYTGTTSTWSDWMTMSGSSVSSSSINTTPYYRPYIRLGIDAFDPCTTTPTAGTAVASVSTACAADSITLSLSGSSMASGITYTWDTSSTGTGGWGTLTTTTAALGKVKIVPPMGKTLYYRCTVVCSAGGTSDVSTTVAVTVGMPKVPPYYEDFESGTFGVNMPCASATRWSDGQYWYLYDGSYGPLENHTSGGSNYLLGGYALECGTSTQEYWWAPVMQLQRGKTYRLSFWYMNDGADWNNPAIGAYIGSSPTRDAMTPIGPYIFTANTDYQQYQTDFTVSSDALYYIGIRVSSTYSWGFAVDDIGLEELPDCATATAADFATGGHATASPNVICSTPDVTTLSVTGTPPFSGLEYSWEVATGTPSSFTATGSTDRTVTETISTGGVYYFRCKVTCTATGMSAYSDVVKVVTTPITPPYTEDFESGTVGENLPCASYSYAWGSSDWYLSGSVKYPGLDNHTPGGSKYLLGGPDLGSSGGTDEYYWFTPGLSLTAGKAYDFSFWYMTDGYVKYDFGARAGVSQDASSMSITIGTDISDDNTDYKQFKGAFIAPTTNTYYIGIKYHAYDWWYGSSIDDIGLTQLPPCSAKPVAGSAKASPSMICSTGETIVSLTGGSLASDLEFQWQTSATGLPGSWSDVTGGSGGTSSAYTTPTLSTGPVYYRAIVTCPLISTANTDTSAPVEVSVGALTPPYFENFESTPVGVNVPCASNTFSWADYWGWYIRGSATGPLDNHTPGGSKFLLGGWELEVSSGDPDYWFTPALKLQAGPTYRFSYWYSMDGYTDATPGTGAYIGTSQDASAMNPIGPFLNTSNTAFKLYEADFTVPSDGDYYMGIRVRSTWSYGFSIDDIGLIQLPECSTATPGAITSAGKAMATPNVVCSTPDVTTLMLTSTPAYSGLDFEWEVATGSPAGFVSAGGTTTTYTYTVSSPGTYYFRCKTTCSATGETAYSDTVKVSTTPITPPYMEDFESGTAGVNMPCASATAWGSGSYFYLRSSSDSWTPSLDNHTPGGSNYLYCGWYLTVRGTRDYWFTPGLSLTGGQLYQFSYWYNTDGATPWTTPDPWPIEFQAFYGTTQDDAGMTTAIHPVIRPGRSTAYTQSKSTFTPATSGVYYIGIYVQGGDINGAVIDDIGLQAVPPCAAPVAAGTIVATPSHICLSGGTTSLDLSGSTLATGLTYRWESKTASTGWTLFGSSTPPLSSGTITETTWFRCIVTCSATLVSDTTATYEITVGGMDLPYSEDFESTAVGDAPLCSDATFWGADPYQGWRVLSGDPTGSGYKNHTPGGKKYLLAGSDLGSDGYYSPLTDDNYWFSPGLNLRTGYKYELSFWYQGYSGATQRMGVYLGGAQSVGAMSTNIYPFINVKGNAQVQIDTTFVLTKPSGLYYFGFRKATAVLGDYGGNGVAFDDININYAPCDGMPFAGAIKGSVPSGTALCTGTAATLTDTGATIKLVPGIKYQWQRRGLGGAPPASWTNIDGAVDTSISADTLVGYEYRLGVVCGNTNDTAFSPAFQLPQATPHPAVSIMPGSSPITFCLGDTVHLTATNYSGGVYDWMRDSVTIPGWKFSDMGATEPGMYMVKVTSPLAPCPAYSSPIELRANDPGYKVDVTVPADSILCDGTVVTLTAVASKPGLSYQWRKDNVDIPGANGPIYVVNSSGYYRVMASDGASSCAAASRNVGFTVKPNPPAVISVPGGTLTACAEVGVLLQANKGAFSYQWYRGAGPVFGWVDSAVIAKDPGTYWVKVRSADGCLSESVPVTVNILPSPVPVITISGPSSGPTLGTSTSTYLSYMWVRNGATNDTTYTPTVTAVKKGTYRVIVTDANGCTGVSAPVVLDDESLGLGNVQLKGSDIRIYPNPTDGKVFIEGPAGLRLEVKDASGKTILEKNNATEVDMSQYADGIYMFMVSDKTGKQLLKEQRVNKTTSR